MTQARMIDQNYAEICQRTLKGAFRMLPTPEVNHLIRYTLWRASRDTSVELIVGVFMANHYHCHVYSPDPARISDFCRQLNSGLAKGLNNLQDESGQVWTREAPQVTPIGSYEHLMSRLTYISANPVRAGIAESRHEHAGVIILPEFADEEHVESRPDNALGKATEQPLEVRGSLHIPRGLMPEGMTDREYMEMARQLCDEADEIARKSHEAEGKTLPKRAEMKRAAEEMWRNEAWQNDGPNEREKARERAKKGGPPRFFAKSAAEVIRERRRQAKFQRLYGIAKDDWLLDDGREIVFPHGTVKMAGQPRVVVSTERIEV